MRTHRRRTDISARVLFGAALAIPGVALAQGQGVAGIEASKAVVMEAIKKPPPPAAVVARSVSACEAHVRSGLKDSGSARISEGRRVGPTIYLNDATLRSAPAVSYVLKVNAMNSFGAYTGDKRWTCYLALDEQSVLASEESGSWN